MSRSTIMPMAMAPSSPAMGGSSGVSSSEGGSQGGGSQGGDSESQPEKGGGQPVVQYVSPYDLPENSKRDTALATLRGYGGGLNWPIGLRTPKPTDEMKELRQHIDGIVESLLRQPANEASPADVVQAATRGIERLARHFEKFAFDLPLSRTQEKDARLFLRNAYAALKTMEPAPAQATLGTAK